MKFHILWKKSIWKDDFFWLQNWSAIKYWEFLGKDDCVELVLKLKTTNISDAYLSWVKIIHEWTISTPIPEYTPFQSLTHWEINTEWSYSLDYWCSHGVVFWTGGFSIRKNLIITYLEALLKGKCEIDSQFSLLENRIFCALELLTWLPVKNHWAFPGFVLRQSYPNSSGQFIGHFTPHFDNGSYLSNQSMYDVLFKEKKLWIDYFKSDIALDNLFVWIIVIQAPEEWWGTILYNNFFDTLVGTINFKSLDQIEVMMKEWDLLIFNGRQLHQINSFIWNNSRIICTFHFKVLQDFCILWY